MRIDFRKLKEQLRLADLLTIIGWKSTKGHGKQLRGPCPLPQCRNKSLAQPAPEDSVFSVHTDKNVYQCFRCRSAGNIFDFWQAYRSTSLHQAATELSQLSKTSNHTSD